MSEKKLVCKKENSTVVKVNPVKKEPICPKCGSKAILPSDSPNGFRHECAYCLWTF